MGGKKFWRFGLAGIVLLLVVAAIIFADTPKEPRYQGRTLTQWVDSAPSGRVSGFLGSRPSYAPPDPWEAATNAMLQMGPDAVRWLVNWSGSRDSKLQTAVIRWVNSRPSLRLPFVTPQNKRRRALIGFELLGTNGGAATTSLIEKTYDRDPKVRVCALECLEHIQPPRETMFPVCFRMMNDTDSYVRAKASAYENDLVMGMSLLSDVKGKQVFLSPLLRWFNDPDPVIRQHSAKLLHFYYPREAEKAGVYQTFPELRKTASAVNFSQ